MIKEIRSLAKPQSRKGIFIFFFLLFSLFSFNFSFGQDFGFGFDDEESASSVSFKVSGEVKADFPFYFYDFEFPWKDIPSAKVNLALSAKYIEANTNFKFSYKTISEFWDKEADWGKLNFTPMFIDEAFMRVFLGPVNITGGLRKLTWGRADSSGPLDVTNPVDFTNLMYITDMRGQKISRLMLHATVNAGNFSKLETVFIPNFAGHKFSKDGRWAPSQYEKMPQLVKDEIKDRIMPSVPPLFIQSFDTLFLQMSDNISDFSFDFPDTSSIKNFQTGLRFSTTIGSVDLGGQYYYGNLFRPCVTIAGIDEFVTNTVSGFFPETFPFINPGYAAEVDTGLITPLVKYTRYHQIGADYAQVLFGFNIRAEFAVNLTEDIKGTDPTLHNPFLAWSLGFDRSLIFGMAINLQCNQTIRLFNDKINSNPIYDCEGDTPVTSTRLTAQLSKNFFKDKLESKATVIWDIENMDCYIIPSLAWTQNSFIFDISAGIFAGNEDGELGQYKRNSFIRMGAKFVF